MTAWISLRSCVIPAESDHDCTPANSSSSEALYEDESFPERGLAALVASKVYYHLQEYNESMVLALGAGKLFKLENGGEYEETIIGKLGTITIILNLDG
jgi:hypothetical protein